MPFRGVYRLAGPAAVTHVRGRPTGIPLLLGRLSLFGVPSPSKCHIRPREAQNTASQTVTSTASTIWEGTFWQVCWRLVVSWLLYFTFIRVILHVWGREGRLDTRRFERLVTPAQEARDAVVRAARRPLTRVPEMKHRVLARGPGQFRGAVLGLLKIL